MNMQLLMPKATAVWLIDNTNLTFEQIADFCSLHILEVKAIADGDSAIGIVGQDPIATGQLTREEIERCEKDASKKLMLATRDLPTPSVVSKGPKYIPLAKRSDKPSAILWLLKAYPKLSDEQIVHLLRTTRTTIEKIKDRSYADISNLKAKDPVILGLCRQTELNEIVALAEQGIVEAYLKKKHAKKIAAAKEVKAEKKAKKHAKAKAEKKAVAKKPVAKKAAAKKVAVKKPVAKKAAVKKAIKVVKKSSKKVSTSKKVEKKNLVKTQKKGANKKMVTKKTATPAAKGAKKPVAKKAAAKKVVAKKAVAKKPVAKKAAAKKPVAKKAVAKKVAAKKPAAKKVVAKKK